MYTSRGVCRCLSLVRFFSEHGPRKIGFRNLTRVHDLSSLDLSPRPMINDLLTSPRGWTGTRSRRFARAISPDVNGIVCFRNAARDS